MTPSCFYLGEWPRGGMVTQRIANPFIPVQFWAWPPRNHDILKNDKENYLIIFSNLK